MTTKKSVRCLCELCKTPDCSRRGMKVPLFPCHVRPRLKVVCPHKETFQEWCDRQRGCINPGAKPCEQCKRAFEAGRRE